MALMIVVSFVAALFALGANVKTPFAQDTASVPKPQDNLALGEDDVSQLMLLIGPNKDGKIAFSGDV